MPKSAPFLSWKLPPRAQLLLEVMLLVVYVLLDMRDIIFKTSWLGPNDTYAFSRSTTQFLESQPLRPFKNFSYPDQKSQRISGWSSFLQKCDTIYPITETSQSPFHFAHGTNCEVGPRGSSKKVPELVFVSSVRVDSMAWTACKLLYHHHKPPICHAPIVKQFPSRYNIQEVPSLLTYSSPTGGALSTWPIKNSLEYLVTPGTDGEMELLNLLDVISKSTPITSVVCVEGFVNNGQGRYTSTIFGCGSSSYYSSAFVGHHAKYFSYFQQDKAWLTSDVLQFMGMTLLVRMNSRSLFTVKATAGGVLALQHTSLLNFSSSGALYTIMVVVDITLMLINAYSAIEIGRIMLWPLWKGLTPSAYRVASYTSKTGFAAEDYKGVLTTSLVRSTPIAFLMLITQTLSWMVMLPTIGLWNDVQTQGGKTHAFLSAIRFWISILLCVNILWDLCVTISEKQAFFFARRTYVSVSELAFIAAIVAYCKRGSVGVIQTKKHLQEAQRIADSISFIGFTALANTYPPDQDSLQNTSPSTLSTIFSPLLEIIGWSVFSIAIFVVLRYMYFRLRYPNIMTKHHSSRQLVQRKGGSIVCPDIPDPPAVDDIHTQYETDSSLGKHVVSDSRDDHDIRLELENVVDIPIQARSLVRSSWIMEKKIGHQVFLRPPHYLEFGIILEGGSMKTRCGFIDIVHPFISVKDLIGPSEDIMGNAILQTSGSSPEKYNQNSLKRKIQHPLR